jgi:predicted ATPase/class 3 adenylate cyclase
VTTPDRRSSTVVLATGYISAEMTELPTGTVTFLFTDVEGSTRLLQRLGSGYRAVIEDHNRLLRESIRGAGGLDLRTEGDAFFAVFRSAEAAVSAAVAGQLALAEHPWPEGVEFRVRMGLHTGEGVPGGDEYVGLDVHRAARIAAAAYGGQIVVSSATRALVQRSLPEGVSVRDLGECRMKDFADAEAIYQVVVPGLQDAFPPLRTLDAPTNLPEFPTSFVGREGELNRVREVVRSARVVTLTGPGGTGKTRLAVEAASTLAPEFPHGTFFVDLEPLTDPGLLVPTISGVLGLRPAADRPVQDVLHEHLRHRRALLLLDNFERILPGAEEVGLLIASAPQVKVLVTSRTPLSLRGEHEFLVPPLPVSEAASGSRDGEPAGSDAVRLFVDRASAVDPAFSIDGETASVVAQICARLDGLPLAIELAASRIRLLPPRDLLTRLEHGLSILSGGPRDAPARQRTLRETIAWSYDLLGERERRMFSRLAVFVGGWTLDAAGEIANPDEELGETLDVLGSLAQASMIKREPSEAEARFGMFETIREFGLERLETSGEAGDVRARHARRFLALAESAERHLIGADHRRWADLLTREHDNVRAVLRWCIERDQAELGLRIAAAVWRFWQFHAHLAEGRRWLDELLGLPSAARTSRARVRGLAAAGSLAYWHGDYPAMSRWYERSLSDARQIGDRSGEAEGLYNMSFSSSMAGDFERARELFEESRAIYEELDDPGGQGRVFRALAFIDALAGDGDSIERNAKAALALLRQVGDRFGEIEALSMLARAAELRGETDASRALYKESLSHHLELRNSPGVAIQLETLAHLAIERGEHERALRLAGVAQGLNAAFGVTTPRPLREFLRVTERLSEALGEAKVAAYLDAQPPTTLEEAVAYGLEHG